jgi:uncharacterized protein (TIGR02145 family)
MWLATNLRTTRYRNGDAIPRPGSNDWQATTSGAFAVQPHTFINGLDSEQDVLAAYGALYNWYAVADPRGLCPTGWRVPSDADWKQLEMHLGMSPAAADSTNRRGTDQGGQLKSVRTDPDAHPRWRLPNTEATNASGWSGVPGGYRIPAGNLGGIENTGYWWSSTAAGATDAWNRNLYYDFGFAYRMSQSKSFGFSVRCIRA